LKVLFNNMMFREHHLKELILFFKQN